MLSLMKKTFAFKVSKMSKLQVCSSKIHEWSNKMKRTDFWTLSQTTRDSPWSDSRKSLIACMNTTCLDYFKAIHSQLFSRLLSCPIPNVASTYQSFTSLWLQIRSSTYWETLRSKTGCLARLECRLKFRYSTWLIQIVRVSIYSSFWECYQEECQSPSLNTCGRE